MPAIGNYIQAIGQRLFDLHLYSTLQVDGQKWADAVYPGNRLERFLKPDWAKGKKRFGPERLQVEWDLRLLRSGSAPAPVVPMTTTFGTVAGTARPRIFNKLYTWQILAAVPSLNYGTAAQLEAITEAVLTAAGAKLALIGDALSYVTGWGPLSSTYTEKALTPGQAPTRLDLALTLPVSVVLTDTDILG
jgi:hypothetical protein